MAPLLALENLDFISMGLVAASRSALGVGTVEAPQLQFIDMPGVFLFLFLVVIPWSGSWCASATDHGGFRGGDSAAFWIQTKFVWSAPVVVADSGGSSDSVPRQSLRTFCLATETVSHSANGVVGVRGAAVYGVCMARWRR